MSNHEWESMNERDFETMLEKSVLDFPPDDVNTMEKSNEPCTHWHGALCYHAELLVPKLYSSCRWNGVVTIRVSFSMA